MPSTTPDGYPYPAQTDPPNGPAQMQALATKSQQVIDDHRAAADPHPAYLLTTEADARYVNETDLAASNPVRGQQSGIKVWGGERVCAIPAGVAVGAGSGPFAVAFTAGLFGSNPHVVVSMANAPSGTGTSQPRAINVTPTGCDIYIYNVGSTATVGNPSARVAIIALGT